MTCAQGLLRLLWGGARSWSATGLDTNFLPKSRECCHEVMVNNCCKSQVALQITARKIMTFFLEISIISGSIKRFPKTFAQRSDDLQKKKVITILAVACDSI